MSWNKYNLYNLSKLRIEESRLGDRTFFQQKWAAKAMTRAYHGEHIKEGQWERMFSRRLNSVVNMEPTYMAEFDGSEYAAGRGSGREVPPTDLSYGKPRNDQKGARKGDVTPYMQMTFAPLERRLDTAIFRAMFASSVRQAGHFVKHGAVKVNGKPVCFEPFPRVSESN